jgi:hypothetical protein
MIKLMRSRNKLISRMIKHSKERMRKLKMKNLKIMRKLIMTKKKEKKKEKEKEKEKKGKKEKKEKKEKREYIVERDLVWKKRILKGQRNQFKKVWHISFHSLLNQL